MGIVKKKPEQYRETIWDEKQLFTTSAAR